MEANDIYDGDEPPATLVNNEAKSLSSSQLMAANSLVEHAESDTSYNGCSAMASSEEDGRKKRQVQPISEESPRKVRVNDNIEKKRSNTEQFSKAHKVAPSSKVASEPEEPSPEAIKPDPAAIKPPSSSDMSSLRSLHNSNNCRVWDLEGALLYLVQLEGKEYLMQDRSAWVTFRLGHAGDASTIASWYRQEKQRVLKEEEEEWEQKKKLEKEPEIEINPSSNRIHTTAGEGEEGGCGDEANATNATNLLEVWLADGFGDDRRLPYLYSLVADVHQEVSSSEPKSSASLNSKGEDEANYKKVPKCPKQESLRVPPDDARENFATKDFGAVALLTMDFDDELEKVLRIEWMGLNPDLSTEVLIMLRQRLWLRLSTLSVMTACRGGIDWKHRFSLDPLEQQQEQEVKQKDRQEDKRKKVAKNSTKKSADIVPPKAE